MSKSQGKGSRGKNLTFVRQVPKFLQHTLKDEPDISSKNAISNAVQDENPDEEYNDLLADKEEERPQVVVLDKDKDISEQEANNHFIKTGKLAAPETLETEEVIKTPAVDKDGRILFRTKVKAKEILDANISSVVKEARDVSKKRGNSGEASKAKKPKRSTGPNLLSFDLD